MYFEDASIEKDFKDLGEVFSPNIDHKIKVETGGSMNMGTIYIDGKQVFCHDLDAFRALRECLNLLWME